MRRAAGRSKRRILGIFEGSHPGTAGIAPEAEAEAAGPPGIWRALHFETADFLREMRDSFQEDGVEALTLYNAQAVLYELPTRLAWELRLGLTEHSWQAPQDIALALRDTRAGIVVAQVRLSPEQDGRRVIAYTFKPGPTIRTGTPHIQARPAQPQPLGMAPRNPRLAAGADGQPAQEADGGRTPGNGLTDEADQRTGQPDEQDPRGNTGGPGFCKAPTTGPDRGGKHGGKR